MADYTARQMAGSEYGGVERTTASIQPKPAETLTPAEILRLGYLTGDETNTESLEDPRQMYGLRPADGTRPQWLSNTGIRSEAQVEGLGED